MEEIMANITRYDPLALDDVFDDLFKGFFVRPMALERQPQVQIKVDVAESDRSYTVRAEIPGVNKEDIHVQIDGNRVSISAEVKKVEEKTGEKLLRCERYYGKTERTFTLAQDVNEPEAQARYANGVLELTLPKKAASAGRKLAIE
jgi:HSP20 family protein